MLMILTLFSDESPWHASLFLPSLRQELWPEARSERAHGPPQWRETICVRALLQGVRTPALTAHPPPPALQPQGLHTAYQGTHQRWSSGSGIYSSISVALKQSLKSDCSFQPREDVVRWHLTYLGYFKPEPQRLPVVVASHYPSSPGPQLNSSPPIPEPRRGSLGFFLQPTDSCLPLPSCYPQRCE